MRRFPTLLVLLPLLACSPQGPAESPDAEAPQTASTDSRQLAPLYVDVRTPEEFATGHVTGAVNIPHDEMESRWRELAGHRDRPVVLYCRTGRRSAMAQQVLEQKGFTDLTNAGGFEELAATGVPTTR